MNQDSLFSTMFGKAIDSEPVSSENLQKINEKLNLPIFLKELLHSDGFGGYADDFLWTCDPTYLMNFTQNTISSDYSPVPFMRTSFGDILFYLRKDNTDIFHFCALNFRHRELVLLFNGSCEDFFNTILTEYGFLFHKLKINLDLYWFTFEKLGATDRNSCYGYITEPADGGKDCPENITRYIVSEYFQKASAMLKTPLSIHI
ncbi:MAG: hypothetical protein JXK07_15115 [Spirochaetes bacterium]|nr:hypothetical protein [Spirochaetota bacterium]MBN2771663.1 hypothetical protein [Spirochaetota bacterium]